MVQINKASEYFNTVTYAGNSSTQSITGVNFQPDFTWIKRRDGTGSGHLMFDIIRGVTVFLGSNDTAGDQTDAATLTSFNSDGFTSGSSAGTNGSGYNYVGWNWLASNTTASNTDGSITSTVSANTTSGFSIVSYTGNGTGNSTIGHGLGAIPKFIIVKNRSATGSWGTKNPAYNSPADPKVLYFDTGGADSSQNVWGTSASFTTLTFTVGDWSGSNTSSQNYIAYCFADVKGFSKFGSYTGNGNADGTFVYTGFTPAFVMMKNTATTTNWHIYDNKRTNNASNPTDDIIFANTSDAESTDSTANPIDFLSNGFKCRGTNSATNSSGNLFIYMAFAENPLVGTNNIPATAR